MDTVQRLKDEHCAMRGKSRDPGAEMAGYGSRSILLFARRRHRLHRHAISLLGRQRQMG